jgi:hypothetical protein
MGSLRILFKAAANEGSRHGDTLQMPRSWKT